MTSEAELQRYRDSFANQQRVLGELKEALTAEPVVRMRWERIRILHGDWHCRTPGAPQPQGLGKGMVRVEVGLLSPGGLAMGEFLAVRLGREPVPIQLAFDYEEDRLDEIPQLVTEAVRAYIKLEGLE